MKISVSTYSFGDDKVKELGIFGVLDKIKEFGADGVEFVDFMETKDMSHEELMEHANKVREHCEKIGLVPANYCTTCDFLTGSDGDAAKEIDMIKKKVDVAKAYGVKIMRHDTTRGFAPERLTKCGFDDAMEILVPACKEITEYAKSQGIVTTTENHGFFAQDADRVEKLINAVGDDNFGALVDMGNFICADENPAYSVGKLARYARNVHAKDFHYKKGNEIDPGEGFFRSRGGDYYKGTIVGHGVVPVKQCIDILKKAGYDGFVGIEFEGMEDTYKGIKISIDNLRRYIGE